MHQSLKTSKGPVSVVLILAASILFVSHAWVYRDWSEDDSYITYLYARNFLAGEGLVFNRGERVEGYSNFLWLMIIAAGMRAGADPVLFSKVAGLVAGLAAMYLSWLLAGRLRPGDRRLTWLAPFYIALSPFISRHCVSGLETSLFAALLAACILVASSEGGERGEAAGKRSRSRGTLLAVLLVLLSLTRLEGPAIAAIILAARWIVARKGNGGSGLRGPGGALYETVLYVILFGSYYIWRWAYFGEFLPNTYYAKMSYGVDALIDGAQYTVEFMRDGGGAVFMLLALVPALFRHRRPAYWMCLAVVVFNTLFVVISGGDWMFSYRFYAHVLPVLIPMIAAGASLLVDAGRSGMVKGKFVNVLASLAVLFAFLVTGAAEWRIAQLVMPAVRSHDYLPQNYEELGLWFRDNSPPDATVAISDVGAFAYYSGRRVLDMFGLVSPHIARLKGRLHFKSDPEYILGSDPDYIILVPQDDRGGGHTFVRAPDKEMTLADEFVEHYELIRRVPQHWNNEHVYVYMRKSI